MSEYYSRWQVEEILEDYGKRLKAQEEEIAKLKHPEEEEEYLSDDEKKVEGERLRNQLTKKYKCDFEKVVQKMNYNDKNEFGDFYFAAFDYYEIKTGVIPKEAFEKARKAQIQNILYYTIADYGERIGWFGSNVVYLNKEHAIRFTNEQCKLVSDLGGFFLLSPQQKSVVMERLAPKQSYDSCLLI